MGKGKLLMKTEIKRESGKLYYCGTDDKGFITINEAVMKRGGKSKKKK
jgi:hypothetical protein